ncbi:alpha/beta hydrolase family protein [Streptacidiphilus sp. N1-12]|uniref:Alpha/beta hydrolase family protein n=2 Tax=Streptacidiphilus alkalitolerans TaxID=3342712 RepID=A0ABV6WTS7_9ACTN
MNELAERVAVRRGLRYGPSGQLLDVYRPAAPPGGRRPGEGLPARPLLPTVLLWHGRPADNRAVLASLATAVAGHGMLVLVPDWRTDAADGGWGELRESLAYTRRRAVEYGGDPGRIVLAGWSLGGRAALATALRPSAASTDGWRPLAVLGLGSNYRSEDELMHPTVMEELTCSAATPIPVHLHHGTADAVVDVARSREFAAALRRRHWPVTLTESDSDHSGVVMAEYDRGLGRCRGATAEHALRAGETTARLIAEAAGVRLPVGVR